MRGLAGSGGAKVRIFFESPKKMLVKLKNRALFHCYHMANTSIMTGKSINRQLHLSIYYKILMIEIMIDMIEIRL